MCRLGSWRLLCSGVGGVGLGCSISIDDERAPPLALEVWERLGDSELCSDLGVVLENDTVLHIAGGGPVVDLTWVPPLLKRACLGREKPELDLIERVGGAAEARLRAGYVPHLTCWLMVECEGGRVEVWRDDARVKVKVRAHGLEPPRLTLLLARGYRHVALEVRDPEALAREVERVAKAVEEILA